MGIITGASSRLRKAGLVGALAATVVAGAVPSVANAAIIIDNTPVTVAYGVNRSVGVSAGNAPIYTIVSEYDDKSDGSPYSYRVYRANGFTPTGKSDLYTFGSGAPGTVIGDSSPFNNNQGSSYIYLFDQEQNDFRFDAVSFFGFKFVQPGSNNVKYGYTKFHLNGDGSAVTLLETAYDDSGAAIEIPSAVPEPAAWMLMIVGFGVVGGAMRRRSATERRLRLRVA